jgi:hypothetical protein
VKKGTKEGTKKGTKKGTHPRLTLREHNKELSRRRLSPLA